MAVDLLIKDQAGRDIYCEKIGSASEFHDLLAAWARVLGFDLEEMAGCGGRKPWTNEPLQFFFLERGDGSLSPRRAQKVLRQTLEDKEKLPEFKREFRVLIVNMQ